MKLSNIIYCIAAVVIVLQHPKALSCTPDRQFNSNEERVRAFYSESEAVFVATVLSVKKVSRNNSEPVEQVHFRVDRVLKGHIKAGDYYETETKLDECSGHSVTNEPVWIEVLDLQKKTQAPFKPSGKWLIYRFSEWPNAFSSRSQPLELTTDIEIINKL